MKSFLRDSSATRIKLFKDSCFYPKEITGQVYKMHMCYVYAAIHNKNRKTSFENRGAVE